MGCEMNSAQSPAKRIFLDAVENHAPDQWPEYLDRACGIDAELRLRVEALLDAHRAEHQTMLQELESIRQRVEAHAGDEAFHEEALSIVNFMMGVTVGHMLGSDLDCAIALQGAQGPRRA